MTSLMENINQFLNFCENGINADFYSPATDCIENQLNLNEYLIRHPYSTFFIRVIGDSMIEEGINNGDLLIVDKSINAGLGHIVIAEIDGEYTVKRLGIIDKKLSLIPANPDFAPIPINDYSDLNIWGVVVYSIHKVSNG